MGTPIDGMKRAARRVTVLAGVAALAGCVVVPKMKVATVDDCGVEARRLALKVVDIGQGAPLVVPCSGSDCAGGVVLAAALGSASAVVSGSIVGVGNTAFWLDEKRQCYLQLHGADAQPAPASPHATTTTPSQDS